MEKITNTAQFAGKKAAWNNVETSSYRKITTILCDAQENSLVFAITGDAGCGKSLTLRLYEERNKNVFVLSCSEYWNRKMFLIELSQRMGRDVSGLTVGDMVNEIVKDFKTKDTPLLVLDEADKLSDQVIYFFITLYNKLEDHCGIILIATDHLEKRMKSGYRHNRKGYKEIYSRVGRRFVKLGDTHTTDIVEVCMANGVSSKAVIERIMNESEGDLRRVRRMVFAEQKKNSK